MFKSKRRLSSAENACAECRGKRKRSQAFPDSPSAITGSLSSHASVRGRGPDVLPDTKAQIAVEYAEAGGKARGDGRSVAAKRGIHPAQPAKFHNQVQDHDMDSKRRRCGRKGLLELRPEVAELIHNALLDDDKQCYRDLAGVVGNPLGPVYRAYEKLKVQQGGGQGYRENEGCSQSKGKCQS